MMEYYFNNTIRNYTTAILTPFTDLYIQRYDKIGRVINENRVLLKYSPQLHWYARNNEYAGKSLDTYGIQIILPMLSCSLQSIAYDSKRQVSAYEILCQDTSLHTGIQEWVQQATPVTLTYDFIAWAEKTTEMTQIIEQILPRYKPTMNLHVKEAPILDVFRTARVLLNSQSWAATPTYDIKSDRQLQWSFNLTVEGYLYPPVHDQGLINYITMNLNDYDTEETFYTETISST